jgi:purine-binding chemotaxis protein CheW
MGSRKCGVIVDDVEEILAIPAENIEDAPSVAGGVQASFILGIGKVDDRLIIALDVMKILTEHEQEHLLPAGTGETA